MIGGKVTGPWFGIFTPLINSPPAPFGPRAYTSCVGGGNGWILGPARFLQSFDWTVWGTGTVGDCTA